MLDGATHTKDHTGESVSSLTHAGADDAMAKIRAAVARAPQGPPLPAAMLARIERNRSQGYPGISMAEMAATVATLPE